MAIPTARTYPSLPPPHYGPSLHEEYPSNAPPPDPRHVASFGTYCLLWDSPEQTHVIGRASDCDIILPEGCDLASERHCELGWRGRHVTIRDLTSTNGTWVNYRRLYDDEIHVLNHGDLIHLTPDPLLRRAHESKTELPSWPSGVYPLEFQIRYHSRDDLVHHGLSFVGCAVRDCLDGMESTRSRLRDIRANLIPSNGQEEMTQTYCAGRARQTLESDNRPHTPVFIPPPALPLEETCPALAFPPGSYLSVSPHPSVTYHELHHDEFHDVEVVHDPDAPPMDHPDIIYRGFVKVNRNAELEYGPVPPEIMRWSQRYCLPYGLHRGWNDFSPVLYGPHLPASSAQPHHFSTAAGFFIPVEAGFPAEKTAGSSTKRKSEFESRQDPATSKRRKTRAQSKHSTSTNAQIAKPATRTPSQPTRARRANPLRGLASSSAMEAAKDDADTSSRPSKRKRDTIGAADEKPKRRALGGPASDDAIPSKSSGVHRTSSKVAQSMRRSTRLRRKIVPTVQND
ncbi:unnamed protein product [Peniophora sp. CBMAI 1063]|nr:unnamed protein product [Peniophora sp. CBMAI 1063]